MKTFDSEAHVYRSAGARLPGATDIIKAEKLVATEYMSEEARWRGKCVHKGIELLNKRELDWSTVDDEVIGYLRSYETFLSATNFEIVGAEEGCWDQAFACMPDLWGILNGCKVIVELKTGVVPKWAALQTAMQQRALKLDRGFAAQKRFGLRLLPTGALAKLQPFDNPRDERVAMGMVDTFHWKLENGYIKWEDKTWQTI